MRITRGVERVAVGADMGGRGVWAGVGGDELARRLRWTFGIDSQGKMREKMISELMG